MKIKSISHYMNGLSCDAIVKREETRLRKVQYLDHGIVDEMNGEKKEI
ncbi:MULTISPECIES: hypothetical protein [Bacillus cereus group]|nr:MULTISPECIES: hypothetical protein [Bacillus cereus group]